ncbi:hypothetical protein Ndes2526B_g01958 [Nannochloris sp. 'desiccata']|nr:hypothetical protein KSW81_005584 [Chlorella desiccata (nom. nud.)]KAH7623518.1 putative plastid-lipid-associated protein 8, chloroplastic [Chlorella desiccata (nom. nud.)]
MSLTASIIAPGLHRNLINVSHPRPCSSSAVSLVGPLRKHTHRLTLNHSSSTTQVAEQAATASPDPAAKAKANLLVDELLQLIDNTDSGDNISNERRIRANDIIRQLQTIGAAQEPRPLNNPLIWGNFNVAYTSQGNAQSGAPAGGRFRSGIGKILFRTTRLCQSVLQPDLVTNKIEALLFGFLPIAVGLRGYLVSIPQQEGGPNKQDCVKVFFDPPELTLPGGINTRIGPPSSVVLTTTFLNERVRLGLGSRGSLFVFTRGGDSDLAEMDQVGLKRTTKAGIALIFSLCASLFIGGVYTVLNNALPTPVRALGVFATLLGTALTSVFVRGGVLDINNYDRPEVVQQKAAATTRGSSA